jgi:glycosyltransferase involved in cell wall biosynthesis
MFEREVAIYRHLQDHGVQVTFVTYGDFRDLNYARLIPGIRILCNRWGFTNRRYERWLPLLHGWFLWHADVYKTNQTNGAGVALRAARIYRKPLIARCGYMWSYFSSREHGDNSEQTRQVRNLEKKVFTAADSVVVTTEQMKQYVAEQYGLENNKVIVIPNYVLTDLFLPDPKINDNPYRICFIGRLDAQKNLFALLEAIRGLKVELEIIGDGLQRKALETSARENGMNVHFYGNRQYSELPHYLNAAGVFILPSLYEGHPKTSLEAMSCGLPVIGTDVPGIRELVRHRETGYLCGTSPSEIRAAIQDVLSDKKLRIKMGKNARKFVVDNFSIEHILKMELELLHELTIEKGI